MAKQKTHAGSTYESATADPIEIAMADTARVTPEPEIHMYKAGGSFCRCDTEARGHATPQGRSPAEIRLDASNGFVPLWAKDVFLKWRFRESALASRPNRAAIKAKIRALFGAALVAWGDSAPITFKEDADVWDFEIVVRSTDDCDSQGCVLASAFFPDPGRHRFVVYPRMFTQEPKEQVDTFIHELGHIFGLRHWFANISETAWPSELFGTDSKFSIMNYGDDSELTSKDKADLKKLYELVRSGALTHINGTPIRLMRPFHEAAAPSGAIAARIAPSDPSELGGRVGAAQQLIQVASDLLAGKLVG
jgi:hypothetical protein